MKIRGNVRDRSDTTLRYVRRLKYHRFYLLFTYGYVNRCRCHKQSLKMFTTYIMHIHLIDFKSELILLNIPTLNLSNKLF